MYTYDYNYQKYMSYALKCNKHVPNTISNVLTVGYILDCGGLVGVGGWCGAG